MSLVDLGKKLLTCAKTGDTEQVRNLMTRGAPFTTDWLGTSPLHLAAQNGHCATAEVLLRAGISRDARTKVEHTPLHLAAQEGHVIIVDLLLKHGADVEAKDMLRMTPLHWAVERGNMSTIELLLQHGASVSSTSKFEKTPLDIAADNGRPDLIEILQAVGSFRLQGAKSDNATVAATQSITEEVIDTGQATEDGDVPPATQQEEVQTTADTEELVQEEADRDTQQIFLRADLPGLEIEKETEEDVEKVEEDDQSSTSVLATLAALAEVSQRNQGTGTVEAFKLLEEHGIAMLPNDNSSIVAAALESGQTITLTEAGKMALRCTKQKPSIPGQVKKNVIVRKANGEGGVGQKVITLKLVDQLVTLSGNKSTKQPLFITLSSDKRQKRPEGIQKSLEPLEKKSKLEAVASVQEEQGLSENTSDSSDLTTLDKEQLARQLEEARRAAEKYKEQLRRKEHEAEEYKKQLESISASPAK